MIHRQVVVGPLQCNCAIVACPRTLEAVLIDPGDEAERIAKEVEAAGLTVKYLLHTHAHFDHVGATSALRKKWNAPVCLHKGDEFLMKALPTQGQMFGYRMAAAPDIERFLEDGETLQIGDLKIETIHTPGHSPGGLCYRVQGATETLFSGDTLFDHSIGRTDLWEGNTDLLLSSIRQRLFTLDDDMPVFPGHGPDTTIGTEKRENPFFS